MRLTAEKKSEIIAQYGGDAKNTGHAEAQVALFTHRISHLTEHLKKNKKDFSTELTLVKLVGKRRSLLNYIAKKDIVHYRELIKATRYQKVTLFACISR
jgi:small subunit ribosomal protein S15